MRARRRAASRRQAIGRRGRRPRRRAPPRRRRAQPAALDERGAVDRRGDDEACRPWILSSSDIAVGASARARGLAEQSFHAGTVKDVNTDRMIRKGEDENAPCRATDRWRRRGRWPSGSTGRSRRSPGRSGAPRSICARTIRSAGLDTLASRRRGEAGTSPQTGAAPRRPAGIFGLSRAAGPAARRTWRTVPQAPAPAALAAARAQPAEGDWLSAFGQAVAPQRGGRLRRRRPRRVRGGRRSLCRPPPAGAG